MSALDRTKAPAVSTTGDIVLRDETVVTLSSGIDLHLIDSGDQDLARLSLLWDGGTLDTACQSLPLFITEGMREGTLHTSGDALADALDFAGARLASRITEHHTGVELTAINRKLPDLLPLMREMILEPQFAPATIAHLARNSAGVLATKMAKVSYHTSAAMMRAIKGPNHPSLLTETPDSILATTQADVQSAWTQIIGSGHLHAYLAGRLAPATIDAVHSFLETMPAPKGSSPIVIVPDCPEAPTRIDIAVDGAVQSSVLMSMPSIPRSHPDYIALRLAIIALGGYFNSRLMTNIREEKGLTYSINSYLLGSFEGSHMSIGAQCDRTYVEQVIEESKAEITRLWTDPLSADELHRLQLNAWTSLAATTDSPFSIADYYILRDEVGTCSDYFQRQLREINSLTSARIAEVAERYLDPTRLTIATAG